MVDVNGAFERIFTENVDYNDFIEFFNLLKNYWDNNDKNNVYKLLLSLNSSIVIELFGDKYFSSIDWDYMLIEGLFRKYNLDVVELIINRAKFKYEYAIAYAINADYPESVIKLLNDLGFDYKKIE